MTVTGGRRGSGPAAAAVPTDADRFNAFEAAGWEDAAKGYDAMIGQVTRRLIDPLLDAVGLRPGMRVLDVATGPGHVAGRAAGRGGAVVGIDIAAAMIALARRSYPDPEFCCGDAEALPFPDDSFDAVVGNFAILHFGRPERAVAEMVRVLRPEGRLALTAWDLPVRMRMLGVVLDAIEEAGAAAPPDLPAGPSFFRYADGDTFAALLTGQGLTGVDVTTVGFTQAIARADELWHGLITGTVRTSVLLRHQPSRTRARIRAAFDRNVEAYRTAAGYLEIPLSVKFASGHKAHGRQRGGTT